MQSDEGGEGNSRVTGVKMKDGSVLESNAVVQIRLAGGREPFFGH